jgi:hypothetical protein
MTKCPQCGGTCVETYMMLYGPMWCEDCGFRVEHKEEPGNPFIDDEPPLPLPVRPTEPRPGIGAGAQMAALMEQERKRKKKK